MSRKAPILMAAMVIGLIALPSVASVTQDTSNNSTQSGTAWKDLLKNLGVESDSPQSDSAYKAAGHLSDAIKEKEALKREEMLKEALKAQSETIDALERAKTALHRFTNYQDVLSTARKIRDLLRKFRIW